MSKVFIGGSRSISHLETEVRKRIDNIIGKGMVVLVGDANGADKAVQSYLCERAYRHVFVFCMIGRCRNNVGGWPVTEVAPPHRTRDFEYFTAKDAVMARQAEYGLMLWDGLSSGTLVNVARLVAANKPVVLYLSAKRSFLELKSREDLQSYLSSCPLVVRERVCERIAENAPEYAQPMMF